MNFKEFLNENDKLKGFKSFLNSRDVARISNNYSEQEERDHLNKTYGDNTIQNRAEAFGVNYDELVKAFGMPPKIIEDPNTGEIAYKWLIWFKDGATAMVIAYAYSGGTKLGDKKYWAVSGTEPSDLVARIERYIKSKGGKLLGENNKLAGLKYVNNLIQFEVTKDPDFYKTGFTTRGSFISTLNDLQDIFGFPLLATAHGKDIDVEQSMIRFAYWGLSFKNGLKIIIMPGIYSSVRDHLINPTIRKSLYINPRIQSINSQEERWYVLTPKESNISKKEIRDRLSFALGVIVENSKLAGLKSFVTSDQIINAKLKAPAIETVQELEKLPEKSIIWYPEHDLRVGTCITKDILLDYIKYQKKTHGSPLRQAWDVYLNGKHIDTVFFSSRGTMHYKDVLDSLIHHDGYDPDIEISTTPDITPEIENKIRNFAKEFNAITETREDELMPAVSVTDEPMDFEADEDELDFNKYPEDYINFVTKAIQKGYKFYQVAYERKFDPNNIRHWWRLLD